MALSIIDGSAFLGFVSLLDNKPVNVAEDISRTFVSISFVVVYVFLYRFWQENDKGI